MATPRALVDSSSAAVLLSLITQAEDPMVLASVPAAQDEDTSITAANDAFCRLSGRSAADLIDVGWLTLCGGGVDARSIDRLKRALYRREHLAIDLPLARADGLDVWTRCELLPARDPRGVAIAVLIVQRDISEQRHTREALASLRKMTRRTSHDVNNGLASVIINLSLASSTRATDDERRAGIRDALKAAREAAETARRLSALATNLEISPRAHHVDVELSPAPPVAPPDATPGTIGSVLILDDEEAVKNLLASYLGGVGFQVDATSNSERCIELYREAFNTGQPFDLVILDLRLGRSRVGGLETLAALKAIDPHVKAIAHSGDSMDDVMLNPKQFGFVASIRKPTVPSEIARLLGDLIRVHAS